MTMPVKYFASKVTLKLYHWFFLLKITVAKLMKNLKVCSAHSYLYPRSRFNKHGYHRNLVGSIYGMSYMKIADIVPIG